jgi:hypothetical protein
MYNPAMNERMQTALDRSRNRPELNRERPDPPKITMKEKLEGETESQYVERLTAEYKAKMSDATPPALFKRAVTFIQAMASKVFELPASEALQAERLEVCFACEHFLVAIDAPEQVGHCAACGCGKSKMTSLPEKAKILKSTCPKNLWDVTIDPAAVALPIAPPPT